MSDVAIVMPEIRALNEKGVMIDDLLGGTKTMRQAGKKYLYQFTLEEEEAYKNRLNRSTLYPALSETLYQMTGRVFFEPITTDDVHDKLKQDILPDVDLEGNNVDVFSSRWFNAGLTYGVAWCLVDYTRTENIRTIADEKAVNARPYFILIKPKNVLGFKTDKIKGKRQITQFRYMEEVAVDDGEFGSKIEKIIYVYEIGRMRKYKATEGQWTLIDDVQLLAQNRPLEVVPVVPFITKESNVFALGEPPLLELAYLNVKHWQSQSDQDNILNTARVPLLGIFSDTEVNKLQVGGSALHLPAGSQIAYIEHSGNAINAGQDSLKELESQMRVAGAKLLDKTVLAMTDSQAKDEQSKEISLLRLYANKFEDALDLALEYVGLWLGIDDVGKVEISGNIDDDLDPNASMDMVIKMQQAGTLSKQTVFNEAKRRGLISDNVEWEDEQARLNEEGVDYGLEFAGQTETKPE
ncbi:DUF4055 domain-containing protein [Glaesserella parasuis]|nr:DUF4055 domain-containing protein [Glaesserella parasuis]MDP0243853.1 DUF4055 domain-containing protein [Glaesserella parasuis]